MLKEHVAMLIDLSQSPQSKQLERVVKGKFPPAVNDNERKRDERGWFLPTD